MTIKEKYLNPNFIDSFWLFGNLEKYGVKVDLFAEDGGHCKAYGVKPCVYFRNGYDDYTDEKLPLILCEHPYIPFHCSLNILTSDFRKLCDFIGKNRKHFILMCDKKIDIFDEHKLYECKKKMLLNEMAIARPNETGLPMSIWLDTGETHKKSGHGKRLKFRDKNSSSDSNSWLTLTIPDLELVGKTDRPIREIDLIRSFYIQNKSLVDKLLSKKIDDKYFLNHITKIDKNGEPIKTIPDYYIYQLDKSVYRLHVVINNDGEFNYFDEKNNKLLSNVWFDKAYLFSFNTMVSSKPIGSVVLNGESFYISLNGKLFTL